MLGPTKGRSMNMNYTADELAFRSEVRRFLEEELPADIAAKVKSGRRLSREDHERWQQILNKQGWYATHWPEEYGGVKWSAVQKHIWDEESNRYGAPRVVPFGVNMVAPVIIQFGSEEQRQYYLPRILSGEDWAVGQTPQIFAFGEGLGDHIEVFLYTIQGLSLVGQINKRFCVARRSFSGNDVF